LYFDSIDNVAWVSRRSNFVHKRKEIGGARSKHGGERCVLEGKKLLGRPRHRWEDNTKIGPKELR